MYWLKKTNTYLVFFTDFFFHCIAKRGRTSDRCENVSRERNKTKNAINTFTTKLSH